MESITKSSIFYGAVINPISLQSYSVSPLCLLSVDAAGNIDWIADEVEPHNLQNVLASKGCLDSEVIALREGEFIIPGFIDTHTVRFLSMIKAK